MSDTGSFPRLADGALDAQPSELVTGRLISLRFVLAALRRRRRLWIGLAVLGLLIGGGYHLVKPPVYWATSTLYLAHPVGSNDSVVAANDLTMVRTVGVGQTAIAGLHEPKLKPLGLLGATPATEPSENIMVLKIAGSTPAEAVRRVDAVTQAYLAFRAEQYDAQNQAIVQATTKQIAQVQRQENRLTREIDDKPASQASQVADLVGQRSTLESQITSLQQTVQSDNLATTALKQGSRVVTAGTLAPTSTKKAVAIDGVTGLIGGLAVGVIVVVLEAVVSDRLWRREDIAGILGAPVELSVARRRGFGGRRRRRSDRSLAKLAARPDPSLQSLVHYLHDRLVKDGSRWVGLVVAVDDVGEPAAGVAALAGRLAGAGRQVVVVDATEEAALGKAYRLRRPAIGQVRIGSGPELTMVVPPKPWQGADGDDWWERMQDQMSHADTVLVVATLDPAFAASHLARWAPRAVVTVTAGRSSAARLNVVGELLEAAGVPATSAVLLDADASDESIGLPETPVPQVDGRSQLAAGATSRLS